MSIWERFESIAKPEEVMEVKNSFTPVEEGVYRARLEELIPAESKNGLPMLKGKFRLVDNNKMVFYNQMLQNLNYPDMNAKNIAEAVEFVNGLLEEEVEFTGLGAFEELITTIPVGLECVLEVSYGKTDYEKKFTKLKVVDKSELPEVEGYDPETGDDIPF